jgi:ribosomal protein S18 acetylase RimI-like enzyme
VSVTVRRATRADLAGITATLARAFDDDPVATFAFPDPGCRRRGLPRFFDIQLRKDYLRSGEVYTNDERTGAALWSPPGKERPGVGALLGLLPLARFVGARGPRVVRFLAAVEAMHPRAPHWYLGVLGTDPAFQGRGIGSAMMGPVLQRCDSEGLPAYLESSKESNVAFYGRHGFEVTREAQPMADGPRLWLMWREPCTRSA